MKRQLLFYCMLIVASLLGTKPVDAQSLTKGYYFIKSLYASAADNACVYDPETTDYVKIRTCQNAKADIFYVEETESGHYTLKNALTNRYIIKFTGTNAVLLSTELEDGVYIIIDKTDDGIYRWKDNTQTNYYNWNGSSLTGGAPLSQTYNYHDWNFEAVPEDVLGSLGLDNGELAEKLEAKNALIAYYNEISEIYEKMTDPSYDDAAFTQEQKTALANKLSDCKTLIDGTATTEEYNNMLAGLKDVYEAVPFIEGGRKSISIAVDELTDGSKIILEVGHANYTGKYMVAYPDNANYNSVKCDDDESLATVWQLEATGANDAIYTDKPTYYMKDLASGKYFGATSQTSLNPNDKRMVDGTEKALSFSFLTKEEIKAKEGVDLNLYNTENPVFIHHSNDDGTWLRLSRFGAYTYVYYISSSNYSTNADWQTWELHSGESNYSVSDELADALEKYGNITFSNIGSDPGCYDAATVEPFNEALAAAQAITSSNTRQEYRTAIDNLNKAYEATLAATVNPITDGYYYIESAWTSKAGQNIVVYDPNDGSNVLKNRANTNSAYEIFQLTTIGDGQYALKNLGSGLYVGQATDANRVTLVESMADGVYQTFTYDANGEFKWKDNQTTYTYYIFGDFIGRYYQQTTGGFDAWYLRTVPQSTIDALLNGISFAVEGNSLVAQGTNIDISYISNALAENSDIANIDLTNATLSEEVTAAELSALLTGNRLAYLPASSTLQGNNIINDGTCSNLVLTDNADFVPQSAFTATQAQYTKSGLDGSGWYSAVLPYNITVPDGVSVLNNARMGDDYITFDKIEAGASIAANTPFLYKTTADNITFETTDATVAASPLTSGDLQGTFVKIPAGDATGKIILNKYGSSFATATEKAAIPAFRAYLNAKAGSRTFSIVIDNELTGIASGDAVNGKAQPVDVCTTDGKLIRKQVDAMTALQGLPEGIYIVNGKKIKK